MNNSVLPELQWHSASGALTFKDVRYLLVRPETLVQLQQAVEAEIGAARAGELLYAGGFAGGQLSGRRYRDVFGLGERQAVEFMCRMGGEIGWGHFELIEFDAGARRLVVAVTDSPFAEAYRRMPCATGDKSSAVCHLIRGVLGGLMAGLFGVDVRAQETQCLFQGNAGCRFEVECVT